MSCGVLHVHVANDLMLDAGTWESGESADRRSVVGSFLLPGRCSSRSLSTWKGSRCLRAVPSRRDAESRAAAAICLRWGSCFAVLAEPDSPVTSDIEDEQTSHISDDEMARLNVEFWPLTGLTSIIVLVLVLVLVLIIVIDRRSGDGSHLRSRKAGRLPLGSRVRRGVLCDGEEAFWSSPSGARSLVTCCPVDPTQHRRRKWETQPEGSREVFRYGPRFRSGMCGDSGCARRFRRDRCRAGRSTESQAEANRRHVNPAGDAVRSRGRVRGMV